MGGFEDPGSGRRKTKSSKGLVSVGLKTLAL